MDQLSAVLIHRGQGQGHKVLLGLLSRCYWSNAPCLDITQGESLLDAEISAFSWEPFPYQMLAGDFLHHFDGDFGSFDLCWRPLHPLQQRRCGTCSDHPNNNNITPSHAFHPGPDSSVSKPVRYPFPRISMKTFRWEIFSPTVHHYDSTVFCVISAPGAFEIKIEKVLLFTVFLH